jgi:ribosome biogenesis GTPase A
MLGKIDEMSDAGGMIMSEPFIIGETIKIVDGPFNDFNGVIEEVNDEKKKLKVKRMLLPRKVAVCGAPGVGKSLFINCVIGHSILPKTNAKNTFFL